jgi:homoserine O-acetyltransferase
MTEALLRVGGSVSFANVQSRGGHDAFLLPEGLDRYGGMIGAFLRPPRNITASDAPPAESLLCTPNLDIQRFLQLIPPHESVLDLGCGDGRVMAALCEHGCRDMVGVELDERSVLACLQRGFNVVHADLNQGLPMFSDDRFEVVLLSQTLQSLVNTEAVLDEVLRVGKRGIVSFPNFGYRRIREDLAQHGRAPRTVCGPLAHPWYTSPNRRYFSLLDWEEFCQARGIRIEGSIYLNTETGEEVTEDPNLNADLVITSVRRER